MSKIIPGANEFMLLSLLALALHGGGHMRPLQGHITSFRSLALLSHKTISIYKSKERRLTMPGDINNPSPV
ncbi:hypothetical protein ASPBRDRAFT_42698 [Aspergillus brasiliensis CBS 101740]|uniref:Uncharacterized protein n=1 Tax=Aspergillus brasiliensis (strain CBS 101740 / IMI 381727 / IBT 21946) TaxID=767769 RepID=A0A1L9UMI5_ASPBC|nr:hypothetical protein ASPBRDRAFT_42698 [Aspergillus brasiliensis CBS 101740]